DVDAGLGAGIDGRLAGAVGSEGRPALAGGDVKRTAVGRSALEEDLVARVQGLAVDAVDGAPGGAGRGSGRGVGARGADIVSREQLPALEGFDQRAMLTTDRSLRSRASVTCGF